MSKIIIIQARQNSTRFPNKVLQYINGIPVIEIIIKRLIKSKKVDQIVVATSRSKKNNDLVKVLKTKGYNVFQGSENNVLNRYIKAAEKYSADTIIRVTADCPLVDPSMLDKMIDVYDKNKCDLVTNVYPPTFPDGYDLEIFRLKSLKKLNTLTKDIYDREHVTSYFYKSKKFNIINFSNKIDLSLKRLTLDEKNDLKLIKIIFNKFKPNIHFKFSDVAKMIKKNPKYFKDTSKRNEGSRLSKGQKVWLRAKNSILNGNMLLSKNPDQHLPDAWPAYFTKTRGAKVWDLDNKMYDDFSLMGVGTNILGYSNKEVDKAVSLTVSKGNLSTLNCSEEVLLAEKLINMHPWSGKVKFARSGGEANAMSIRIARCNSKNDKIAFCGYHGWHDWYLAANLKKDSLGNHLLPGLQTTGVPKKYKDTIYGFNYGDIDRLKYLIDKKNISIVKMEFARSHLDLDFIKEVRELTKLKKVILIFDECTSGFRENFGGLHMKYNIYPDIATFGKALGNGYAITAVVGSDKVMNNASSSFISSTFWTERIGPTAALKTLELMEKKKSWNYITKLGKHIKKEWSRLAKKNNLDITIAGLDAICNFKLEYEDWIIYKTYVTQEMLKNKILATNIIYISQSHTKKSLNRYLKILDVIFSKISDAEKNSGAKLLLDSRPSDIGFKRIN